MTGACLPAYSGRVVHAAVPLQQPDGRQTTMGDVKEYFRCHWPKDLRELADSVAAAPIKVLKTGRVVEDQAILEDQLTASEKAACIEGPDEVAGGRAEEAQRPSVVFHMVVQRMPVAASQKTKKGKESNTFAEGNASNEGREVKKDSCCCFM